MQQQNKAIDITSNKIKADLQELKGRIDNPGRSSNMPGVTGEDLLLRIKYRRDVIDSVIQAANDVAEMGRAFYNEDAIKSCKNQCINNKIAAYKKYVEDLRKAIIAHSKRYSAQDDTRIMPMHASDIIKDEYVKIKSTWRWHEKELKAIKHAWPLLQRVVDDSFASVNMFSQLLEDITKIADKDISEITTEYERKIRKYEDIFIVSQEESRSKIIHEYYKETEALQADLQNLQANFKEKEAEIAELRRKFDIDKVLLQKKIWKLAEELEKVTKLNKQYEAQKYEAQQEIEALNDENKRLKEAVHEFEKEQIKRDERNQQNMNQHDALEDKEIALKTDIKNLKQQLKTYEDMIKKLEKDNERLHEKHKNMTITQYDLQAQLKQSEYDKQRLIVKSQNELQQYLEATEEEKKQLVLQNQALQEDRHEVCVVRQHGTRTRKFGDTEGTETVQKEMVINMHAYKQSEWQNKEESDNPRAFFMNGDTNYLFCRMFTSIALSQDYNMHMLTAQNPESVQKRHQWLMNFVQTAAESDRKAFENSSMLLEMHEGKLSVRYGEKHRYFDNIENVAVIDILSEVVRQGINDKSVLCKRGFQKIHDSISHSSSLF